MRRYRPRDTCNVGRSPTARAIMRRRRPSTRSASTGSSWVRFSHGSKAEARRIRNTAVGAVPDDAQERVRQHLQDLGDLTFSERLHRLLARLEGLGDEIAGRSSEPQGDTTTSTPKRGRDLWVQSVKNTATVSLTSAACHLKTSCAMPLRCRCSTSLFAGVDCRSSAAHRGTPRRHRGGLPPVLDIQRLSAGRDPAMA
jgi:hypothetical protein